MKNQPQPENSLGSTPGSRPNLNKAAEQVAAAYGLTLGYRENQEPTSERMSYRWSCTDESTGQSWDMELVCLPVLWGQEGWIGSVRISRYGAREILDKWFVSYGDRLYGRKAAKLTRERFCAWAALLEPGSRLDWKADAAKQETLKQELPPIKPFNEILDDFLEKIRPRSSLPQKNSAGKPATPEKA